MREVSTDQGHDEEELEDSSDVSGYHSDSDSAIMASGNSPFFSKSARYNFLSRSGKFLSRERRETCLSFLRFSAGVVVLHAALSCWLPDFMRGCLALNTIQPRFLIFIPGRPTPRFLCPNLTIIIIIYNVFFSSSLCYLFFALAVMRLTRFVPLCTHVEQAQSRFYRVIHLDHCYDIQLAFLPLSNCNSASFNGARKRDKNEIYIFIR